MTRPRILEVRTKILKANDELARGMRRELGFGGRIGCEADNEGEESEGCGESDGGSDRKSHTDAGR